MTSGCPKDEHGDTAGHLTVIVIVLVVGDVGGCVGRIAPCFLRCSISRTLLPRTGTSSTITATSTATSTIITLGVCNLSSL